MARPPDHQRTPSMKGTQVLVVLVTLCAFFLPSRAAAQSSTAWTFSEPGVSHITFSPPLSRAGIFRLEFSFRTLQANGMLLYQEVSEAGRAGEEREEVSSLLEGFRLFVEMRQGHLRVGHMFGHYKDVLNTGRALNDDKWHKMALALNQTSGELSVTLDTNSVTQFLKAYLWGNARQTLDWSQVPTSVKLGGTQGGAGRTSDFPSFIGCLQNLKYSVDSAVLLDIPVDKREGVTPGCIDRCEGGDRCRNNGRCVNLYTDYHCDCFGTDYEGRQCEKQGPSVLTFSGYEWVTYQLYRGEENRPFSDHNRIALEFKTERPSGILLYAVGGSPYHNHITAALHSGELHVSVAFGDDDLDFPIGIGLDDNRWHNLTIQHNGKRVDVYLDGDLNTRSVKNGDFHLSLDPLAYIGGGDNFVITRGLPVTRNFVGCMKNVYFSHHSVLYRLSQGSDLCIYHGGERPTFDCSPVQDIPISFPNSASVLRWSLGSMDENLTVDFQFRTVRRDSILFYVELESRRQSGGRDYGLMEVWIIKGQPMLMFIPSIRDSTSSENITLPLVVNDQQWHSMKIDLHQSQATLKVDAVSRGTHQYGKPLSHKGQVILGFGLRGYKQSEGYVGCMEQIVIQGKKLDPITVVESNSAIGLKLDGCYLVDHCSQGNICQHGSQCLSDWDGVQCDCLDHSYEGKACHFSKYPSTCDDYYQAGRTQSGVYLIDVDGHGPLDPVYVECAMGSQRDGHLYGATIVEHNFLFNTHVRGRLLEDRRYTLVYREMDGRQLKALGKTSASCEQYFKYTCQNAPILLGKKTWFRAANHRIVDYLGAARAGFCTCPQSGDETCDGQKCFCDHGDEEVRQDEGYSHNKEQLPITEMTFLQMSAFHGDGNMTLGPFTCWGDDKQHLDNLVTLATEESHMRLHTWTGGDLGFHFKTHLDRALLLLHTSTDPIFGNMMTVRIISQNRVEFYFRLNNTLIRETLRTPRPISQGDWHYILIEHDPHNVRLTFDTTRRLVQLDRTLSGVVDFNGLLYIGGMPVEVASSYRERTPGFSGCIRAFLYNHEEVALSTLINGRTSGVSTGCMSSCWPNPCQHGGTCKEDWGHYACHCSDPWAHRGHNCEYNLNSDAVTFSGRSDSFLTYDLSGQRGILDQTVVMSFRTFQSDALLLYAYDHMSNFIQMELQEGNKIVFSYNNQRNIVRGSITATDALNDGEWKQVVAQDYYNLTKLMYKDQSHIVGQKRGRISTYSIDPFRDSQLKETVFMARGYEQPSPFLRLYVGGLGAGGTAISFLKGCVRGMRIGNYHVNLGQGVQARGNTSDLTASCDAGCQEDTCLNDGICYEHWKYGNFTCDCTDSDYSGQRCENEASANLDGQAVVEHTFSLPISAQRSVTEQLMLNFKTIGTKATNQDGERMDMVIIYIKSTEYGDYIIVRLDSKGSVMVETNQGEGMYRMKVLGNFSNGDLHELVYKREGKNMYLTLDGVREATVAYPDFHLDHIDTIAIGGLLPEDEADFQDTANFTGCISNVVFIPESNLDLKIRSLKALHSGNPEVIVHGSDVFSCSEPMLAGKVVTEAPDTEEITTQAVEILTMPSWVVGPAEVMTLSPPRVSTPAPATTTSPTTTTTAIARAMMTQGDEDSIGDLAVIITVSIVAGILVVALIIALLLLRKRRRSYDGKKDADMELKQPLNYQPANQVQSSPVPPDHLAKLDEFSMVSATLGPRSEGNNSASNTSEPTMRHSEGSLPKADPNATFEHPIFSKKKQRPASSISEVLEEMERRQTRNNSAENIVGRPHGEGELEWDPQADRTPLTYKPDDHSPSGDESQGNHNSILDGNGDSGYEAESRPEITEDDVTPTEDLSDDPADPKLYMYNISSMDGEESPVLTSPSRQRLLRRSSKET